ncbi:hypothetical protein [Mesonia mobilis]|uniref:hypothetical protein n=1 Tax=Mesonia mobilis TaxID=369791 RepID=UPI0024BB742F|nr:hypothetical protein [Mesonia mobilis]
MTANQIINILKKYPADTKVGVRGDNSEFLEIYDLEEIEDLSGKWIGINAEDKLFSRED